MSSGHGPRPIASSPRTDLIEALAGEIGPRPAGSAAEIRAAEAVARAFDGAGVASVQLPVRVRPPGRWEALLYAPAALSAALVGLWQPWAGLAVAALALVGCAADINGRPILTRALPRVPARNVLAIVAPARQEIRRLVALADLDSPAPLAPGSLRMLASARAIRLALLALLAALTVTLFTRALADADNRWTLSLLEVEAGGLALLLTGAGWLTWRGEAARGAVTNASGVAALVDLAAHARAFPPAWIETWFLAASAGSANADGLRAFLAANRFDVESTYFIHLHGVGAGELRVAAGEGDVFPRRASPLLARLIALAGGDKPAVAARPLRRLARATQNAVALSRGYDAITLVGDGARDDGTGDDPSVVEPAAVQRAVGLLIGVLERLDAEADERNRRARLARASAATTSRD